MEPIKYEYQFGSNLDGITWHRNKKPTKEEIDSLQKEMRKNPGRIVPSPPEFAVQSKAGN